MLEQYGFEEKSLLKLSENKNHFWFTSRNRTIEKFLHLCESSKISLNILELGCGAGAICSHLSQKGYSVDASDLYPSALTLIDSNVKNKFVFDLKEKTIPGAFVRKYDVVILGDVIEHLEDPISTLETVKEFLKKDGCILITVPALKSLWTDYDVQSGHVKRYTKESLLNELNGSGYKVRKISYFMFLPSILLFVQRKIGSLVKSQKNNYDDCLKINPILNGIMKGIMWVEYVVSQILPTPFGSSLIAIGRKHHEG